MILFPLYLEKLRYLTKTESVKQWSVVAKHADI